MPHRVNVRLTPPPDPPLALDFVPWATIGARDASQAVTPAAGPPDPSRDPASVVRFARRNPTRETVRACCSHGQRALGA